MYAYVICRLDIGYAICFLARFSNAPHHDHFYALKGVCKYLRATKHWGIMYQRPFPLMDLPDVKFDFLSEDPALPDFPTFQRDQLYGLLDAAHGTDLKTRRSVTGFILFFCCAAVAWKSRLQPIVATSSTEAEFYAAVTCGKAAKYLRYILLELDAMASTPTDLLIDNQAALAMINESRPTPRARHINIQHFAIQEWVQQKDLLMKHIPGVINPSDDLTKPLGWVLHARHARRAMGHYKIKIGSQKASTYVATCPPQEATKPGRVMVPDPGQSRDTGTAVVADTKDTISPSSRDMDRVMTGPSLKVNGSRSL